jgi:hypothetical protein
MSSRFRFGLHALAFVLQLGCRAGIATADIVSTMPRLRDVLEAGRTLHPSIGVGLGAADDSVAAPSDSGLAMPAITPAISDTVDALAFPDPEERRWQIGLLRPDRLQHASLALTISLATGLMTREPLVGLAAGLGAGVAKETWDLHRTGFDWVDLAADAVGCAIGTAAAAALVP